MTGRDPDQGELFPELVQPSAGKASLEERFLAFHSANPQVLRLLHSYVLELVDRGVPRCGIAGLVERLRSDSTVRTKAGRPYKINNSFRAFYARLLATAPGVPAGFFELRRSVADEPERAA